MAYSNVDQANELAKLFYENIKNTRCPDVIAHEMFEGGTYKKSDTILQTIFPDLTHQELDSFWKISRGEWIPRVKQELLDKYPQMCFALNLYNTEFNTNENELVVKSTHKRAYEDANEMVINNACERAYEDIQRPDINEHQRYTIGAAFRLENEAMSYLAEHGSIKTVQEYLSSSMPTGYYCPEPIAETVLENLRQIAKDGGLKQEDDKPLTNMYSFYSKRPVLLSFSSNGFCETLTMINNNKKWTPEEKEELQKIFINNYLHAGNYDKQQTVVLNAKDAIEENLPELITENISLYEYAERQTLKELYNEENYENGVWYKDNVAYRAQPGYQGEIVIKEGTTEIDLDFFSKQLYSVPYKGITGISLPSTLEKLLCSEWDRTSIKNIAIPDNVTQIKNLIDVENISYTENLKALDGPDARNAKYLWGAEHSSNANVPFIENGIAYRDAEKNKVIGWKREALGNDNTFPLAASVRSFQYPGRTSRTIDDLGPGPDTIMIENGCSADVLNALIACYPHAEITTPNGKPVEMIHSQPDTPDMKFIYNPYTREITIPDGAETLNFSPAFLSEGIATTINSIIIPATFKDADSFDFVRYWDELYDVKCKEGISLDVVAEIKQRCPGLSFVLIPSEKEQEAIGLRSKVDDINKKAKQKEQDSRDNIEERPNNVPLHKNEDNEVGD